MDLDIHNSDINPNLKCRVCGSSEYQLREGSSFCQECGTKQDHQEYEVDYDTQYRDANITKTMTLKKLKIEAPNLTSWECYNFILRGLVQELINLGAKEEFKLITLQLWAAYLRRNEVAFFNKKQAELPKLSARYFKRDVKVLYNHIGKVPKKRKRKGSDVTSSGDTSREWRKSKRLLDESLYASSSSFTEPNSTLNSSSTGTTKRAIQLQFSSHARKTLKKKMPVNHLKKHEEDAEGLLTCHSFPLQRQCLTENEALMSRLSIRPIFTILAIALNLAEDEIQLVDLVRFIAEGHIGSKNILQYFPENVQMHGKEILNDIDFYRYTEKLAYRALRENISFMAKLINLKDYRTPDINALARRYICELNLPPQMATYVERLINIFPPQMPIRSCKLYPAYEARAMAYIVFVLKLLFGLDGHKECDISEAAKKINEEIHASSEISKSRHDKLFVWSEWVEYIEMRKVIISQYNCTYSQQFKISQRMPQKIEELGEMLRAKIQRELIISDVAPDVSKDTQDNVGKIYSLMNQFIDSQKNNNRELDEADTITFQASYTPSDTYFKRIRLHISMNAENPNTNIKIPEFMRVDHTLRTLEPYLNSKFLREFLQSIHIQLNVKSIPCTEKKKYVGMFVNNKDFFQKSYKADFKIKKKDWLEKIIEEPYPEEVVFKEKLDCYEKQYMKKLESLAVKRQLRDINESILSHVLGAVGNNDDGIGNSINSVNLTKNETNESILDVMSLASIEVFNENNMEPVKGLTFNGPRRDMDNFNILETNQEELDIDQEDEDPSTSNKTLKRSLTLLKSNMDYWILFGYIGPMTDIKKKNMENKFPRSFFWLLETCAQVINIDWGVLYDQLMAIEIIFGYGIEPLDDFKDCIRFKHLNKIKDINLLVNWYRDIW